MISTRPRTPFPSNARCVSADRKRVTATYTGSLSKDGGAYPVSLFYTNTVNLLQAQDLGFDDFTDAYTMAGYVLSDDVKFNGISSDVEAAVLEYRSSLDIDTLTRIFDGADFPWHLKPSGLSPLVMRNRNHLFLHAGPPCPGRLRHSCI